MSKHDFLFVLALIVAIVAPGSFAADSGLSTLFTTVQERKLINKNRYLKEEKLAQTKVQTDAAEVEQVRAIEMEEVVSRFRVSGISITHDGARSAWINGQMHDSGATLDPDVKMRVNDGQLKSVTLAVPDGRQFTAVSGETVEIPFMQPVQQP